MDKIRLTTSGLPVGEKTNVRTPDLDHAVTIIDFTKRGYIVGAQTGHDGWYLLFTASAPYNEMTTIRSRLYLYNEDARLLDGEPPPEWVKRLHHLILTIIPPDTVLRGWITYNHEGAANG